MTVLAPFFAQRDARPDRTAIIAASGRSVSYAELDRWSRALAVAWCRQGVASGTRILVALPMAPPLYAALIALWRLGAVAVFPEPAAGFAGLSRAVAAASPAAFIGPRWLGWICRLRFGLPSLTQPSRRVGGAPIADERTFPPEHPALITFTSGSTGRPKGILRSHGFLIAQQDALAPLLRADGAVDLVSLPMFVLAGLGFGTTSVIPDGPVRRPAAMDPRRLLRQIIHHRVTRILAPPALCERLGELPLPAHVGWIITGGGPVFPGLVRSLQRAAPGAEIIAVYGSTEAEPIAHVSLSRAAVEDWQEMEGGGLLVGHPVPEIRLRLVDDEIVVAGAHVNKAYLDSVDDARNKHKQDGEIWHRTGDAGRLDGQGRLWLLGRKDALVGGLYPFAVEVAALSWPGVAQAALAKLGDEPILTIAGDEAHAATWRAQSATFPNLTLRVLPRLPVDRRHNSKIDYAALAALLQNRPLP
jgi:acyl-CoA synthetase (AMP-forming)/AMP-acid ligase II